MLLASLYSFVLILIFDYVWLGIIAKDFISMQLSGMLLDPFRIDAALMFYIIYAIGISFFAILPGLTEKNRLVIFLRGAFFGFVCYSTFDLTCYAIFKGFPATMVIVDVLWGTIMTGLVTTIVVFIQSKR